MFFLVYYIIMQLLHRHTTLTLRNDDFFIVRLYYLQMYQFSKEGMKSTGNKS